MSFQFRPDAFGGGSICERLWRWSLGLWLLWSAAGGTIDRRPKTEDWSEAVDALPDDRQMACARRCPDARCRAAGDAAGRLELPGRLRVLALGALSILLAVLALVVGGFRTGEWMRALPLIAGGLAVLAVPVLMVLRSRRWRRRFTTSPPTPPIRRRSCRRCRCARRPTRRTRRNTAAPTWRRSSSARFPTSSRWSLPLPPQQAFDRVLAQVRELGWEVSRIRAGRGAHRGRGHHLLLRLQGRRGDSPAAHRRRHARGRALQVARRRGRPRRQRRAHSPPACGVTRQEARRA